MTSPPPSMSVTVLSTQTLGPLVRDRRRAQGLRIDDAAGLLNVSVDLMSRLENGQGSVRLDKLLGVLDGLGLALLVSPKEHPWAQQARAARTEPPPSLSPSSSPTAAERVAGRARKP